MDDKTMVERPGISDALRIVGWFEIVACWVMFLYGFSAYMAPAFSLDQPVAAALMKISVAGAVGGLLWLAAGEMIFLLARIERALRGPALAPAIVPAAENRMMA